jgi:pteridine reductase
VTDDTEPSRGLRALVTGAGKRVGRSIALALGQRGGRVVVHYHHSEREAEATRRDIAAAGGEALCLRADLSDRVAARKLVQETVNALGGLDLLVASAAGYERTPLAEVSDEAWDRMLELNLTSPFVLSRHALPALRASRGSIVFVTCSSATTPFRNHLPYVVAKGALRHLMKTLALEVAPEVRVNAVAPGTVLPPETMDATTLTRLKEAILLKRFGDTDDVARAVLFLVNSPFVTGHEIAVDGGRSVAKAEQFG